MPTHTTGTREQWLQARIELPSGGEGTHPARATELARRRQELPWVRVDKPYHIRRPTRGAVRSKTSSTDVRSCSSTTSCSGPTTWLAARHALRLRMGSTALPFTWPITTSWFSAVSRAPLAKLQAFKQRMGWTFPWASSSGSDFNTDFNVRVTEEQQRNGGVEYNYRGRGSMASARQ